MTDQIKEFRALAQSVTLTEGEKKTLLESLFLNANQPATPTTVSSLWSKLWKVN